MRRANVIEGEADIDRIFGDQAEQQQDNPAKPQRCGWPYEVTDDGVFWLKQNVNGITDRIKLSARVDVVAKTRDAGGTNQGRLLRWQDDEGGEHQWPMPMELLASDTAAIRARLLSEGLPYLNPNVRLRERFGEYLQTAPVPERIRCVDRIGWHAQTYVLPDGSISPDGAETVLFVSPHDAAHNWTISGTAEDWREHVGKVCMGNSRLLMAVSCAFAGPILSLLGAESGGVHLVGATCTGKTTALAVAASVCGEPKFVQTWRATANGLEAMAEAHNDATLLLDELAQLEPHEANEVAYLLANGQGKSRMSRTIGIRKKPVWRVLFLSTGELSLSEHAGSVGRKTKGGTDVRLLNIPAEPGSGMGIFENLHSYGSPDAFAHALRDAAGKYYGSVFRSYVAKLIENRMQSETTIRAGQHEFLKRYTPAGATGEVNRAADRFALIGAAGELATEFGLTGWNQGESFDAAHRCYAAWLLERGTAGASDLEKAVGQVRGFLEAHGSSRFQLTRGCRSEEQMNIRNRAGFRRSNVVTGEKEFLILREPFEAEVCKGFRYREVAHELETRGFLVRQPPALTIKTSIPELSDKDTHVFCIRASILEGENEG